MYLYVHSFPYLMLQRIIPSKAWILCLMPRGGYTGGRFLRDMSTGRSPFTVNRWEIEDEFLGSG